MRNPSSTTTRPSVQGRAPSRRRRLSGLPGFALLAVGICVPLMALSTQVVQAAPFVLAAVLLGLAAPALVLTHAESGGAGVRALLRDCVRLPRRWWWLALAGFGLPALTWTTGLVVGGAEPLDWGLAWFYVADLLVGALVINIWEEMAWTGFFQRRAAGRWGEVGGSLVTSVFFTAVHLPLVLGDGSQGLAGRLLMLVAVAVGVRLLIARFDPWCGRSLLAVGVLHSSFNASESLLDDDHFWVRPAVTVLVGLLLVAFGRQRTAA